MIRSKGRTKVIGPCVSLAAAAVGLILPISARAQTFIWQGPNLGAWNNASNWNPNGVPNLNVNVVNNSANSIWLSSGGYYVNSFLSTDPNANIYLLNSYLRDWNTPSTFTINGGTAFSTGESQLEGFTVGGSGNITNGGILTLTLMNFASGTHFNALSNTDTFIQNGLTNNGTFAINAGSGFNSYITIDGGNTLSGTGTLTLSSGAGSAIIQAVGSGGQLFSSSTIQGNGEIGNGNLALSNLGTINANVSGQSLTLDGTGATSNSGTIEATAGGVLGLLGVTVNNQGGAITANTGGTVQLYNGTIIQGGSLNNNGGGFFGAPQGASATLDGSTAGALTLNGTYTGALGSTTTIQGIILNNGNIQINGGGGTSGVLFLGGDTTIEGGTVTLSTTTGSGSVYITGGAVTLTNDGTIQGNGVIGSGGLALTNNGLIDANVPGYTLILNGTGGVTNNGTIEATGGGVLAKSGNFTNVGTVMVGSGSNMFVGGGTGIYTQTGGITTVNGTLDPLTINLTGGLLNGTGTVDGNVTASGGTIAPGTTNVTGELTINGGLADTGSTLDIRLGGTGAGQFDVLDVNGDVNLGAGSILDVTLINGFTPTNGETFTFFDFSGSLSSQPGFFGTDDLPSVQGGTFSIEEQNSDELTLVFNSNQNPNGTPEPAPVMMLVSGAVAWWLLRRRTRNLGANPNIQPNRGRSRREQ